MSIGGKPTRITTLEALVLSIRHQSAKGHRAASALCDKYRGYSSIHDPEPPPRAVLIVPEKLTPEEYEERYSVLIYGRTTSPPIGLPEAAVHV
jgi:hypothetical protein